MTTTDEHCSIDFVEPPSWLGDEIDGERVIAWRLTKKLVEETALRIIGRDWRYEIITETSFYTAKVDGTFVSVGMINIV